MKRVWAVLLALFILLSVMPLSAFAESGGEAPEWDKDPAFVVSSEEATPGEVLDVRISIRNNPGIVSFVWDITYDDSVLQLLKVTPLQYTSMVLGPQEISPFTVNWCEGDRYEDCTDEGEVLLLTFAVADDAMPGTYPIDLCYDMDNVFNVAFESVWFHRNTGWVTVRGGECHHAYDNDCDSDCNLCGEKRETAGHVYQLLPQMLKPTCTEAGRYYYYCEICDHRYNEDIPALGHVYDVTSVAPTCTVAGSTTYVCEVCGHRYTVKVAATGHNYQKTTVAPVCGVQGYDLYTCANCGDQYQENHTPALEHEYSKMVIDPTCTEEGYTYHYCLLCGKGSYTDYVAPHGHKPIKDVIRYECETPTTCAYCWLVMEPAPGHDYVAEVTKPTCTEEGYTTHTCTRCDHSYVDDVVEAEGHWYMTAMTKPNCTAEGYTTYTCMKCGYAYVDNVVEALGHSYDNACDSTCNACDHVREVGDHVYDDDDDATCNECGYEREIPFLLGDVNDDGKVNVRDQGLLQQYLNGWSVTLNLSAADVNGDGKVNVRDQGLLQQYLNGWDVKLGA